MTPETIARLVQEVQTAAEALRIVDFNERKQEFFCRACRYRDPLVDGNRLHDDNCPWVEYVQTFKRLLDASAALVASPVEPEPTTDDALVNLCNRVEQAIYEHVAPGQREPLLAAIGRDKVPFGPASRAPGEPGAPR
jgi:hypothetical protein